MAEKKVAEKKTVAKVAPKAVAAKVAAPKATEKKVAEVKATEVKATAPKAVAKPVAKKAVAAKVAEAKTAPASKKADVIGKFKQSENDTGSAQVQIALLTARISHLTEHLKTNKHDNHTRRGLLQMVGKRKSFMNYLQKKDITAYRALIKELNIRG